MTERALRVAVIGSGPSGFYAVEALQKDGRPLEVDMYDRLPTPYGLVRGGVAPDHPKIKSVVRVYEKMAQHPSFRFLGNVAIGRDLSHDELLAHYDAVIYAVGAQTDRALGIPGEHLAGSHAATDFVGWYNGHPDYRDRTFDLTQERAVIVGVGNVAMDVARILASTPEELGTTDIADHALEALASSRVREIVLLGRRGPVQAAFTHPELKEFGVLHAADVVVDPADLLLDEASQAALEATEDNDIRKNVELLKVYAERPRAGKPKRVEFRFLTSPLELHGETAVNAITLGRNHIVAGSNGDLKAEPTGETERLATGLVFRSVGYKGVPVPGVPFDERGGTIPNVEGRVVEARGSSAVVPGVYVAGWIKRGPSGVIGTNKPDSHATAASLLADHTAGRLPTPTGDRSGIDRLLADRQVDVVSFDDWRRLDAVEQERGKPAGRPRVKFTRVAEMMDVVRRARASAE